MKIALGSDHAAFQMKQMIKQHLQDQGFTCQDFGTDSEERADYPLFAGKVARAVASGEFERGILLCGTGVGMSITANKFRGIRAVVCSEPYSAVLSRQHNHTNILCLGSRVVGPDLAWMIVSQWLQAEYEGGRHQHRLDMITALEDEPLQAKPD